MPHGVLIADTAIDVLAEAKPVFSNIPLSNVNQLISNAFAIAKNKMSYKNIAKNVVIENIEIISKKFFNKTTKLFISQIYHHYGVKTANLYSFYLLPFNVAIEGVFTISQENKYLTRGMLQLTLGKYLVTKLFSSHINSDSTFKIKLFIMLCRWRGFYNNEKAISTGVISKIASCFLLKSEDGKKNSQN